MSAIRFQMVHGLNRQEITSVGAGYSKTWALDLNSTTSPNFMASLALTNQLSNVQFM